MFVSCLLPSVMAPVYTFRLVRDESVGVTQGNVQELIRFVLPPSASGAAPPVFTAGRIRPFRTLFGCVRKREEQAASVPFAL